MSSYINTGATQSDSFKILSKFASDSVCLLKGLSEFKMLFTNVPQLYTQDSFAKSHISILDKYSSVYVGKKKSVRDQSDKIQDNYFTNDFTVVANEDIAKKSKVLEEISKYFSEEEEQLPTHYVDAYPTRIAVVDKVSGYMKRVSSMIVSTMSVLDDMRGSPGSGTKEIYALFTDAKALAAFPGNVKKIEHLVIDEIREVNKIALNKAVQAVQIFTGILKQGADKISATMARLHKERLSRTILIGFPSTAIVARDQSLEDTVREKVRKKFGGIRFCDEEEIKTSEGYSVFRKQSELMEVKDPAGGTVKVPKSIGEAQIIENDLGPMG